MKKNEGEKEEADFPQTGNNIKITEMSAELLKGKDTISIIRYVHMYIKLFRRFGDS
jgi:hypothetical protein